MPPSELIIGQPDKTHVKIQISHKGVPEMSSLDSFATAFKEVLEAAKDLPTEKVCAVGLVLIAAGSMLKDMTSGNAIDAIEKAKDLVDMR